VRVGDFVKQFSKVLVATCFNEEPFLEWTHWKAIYNACFRYLQSAWSL